MSNTNLNGAYYCGPGEVTDPSVQNEASTFVRNVTWDPPDP